MNSKDGIDFAMLFTLRERWGELHLFHERDDYRRYYDYEFPDLSSDLGRLTEEVKVVERAGGRGGSESRTGNRSGI